MIDGRGDTIWGDKLMVLFSRAILARHPGAAIISEVKCSQTLYDDIAAHGGRPIMWRTGHSLIKKKMKEEQALLAGEMSGHMFFADRFYRFRLSFPRPGADACRLCSRSPKCGRSFASCATRIDLLYRSYMEAVYGFLNVFRCG